MSIVTHELEYEDLAHWITESEDDWETSADAMHWEAEETA